MRFFPPIAKHICLQESGYKAEYYYHIIQQTFWIALELSVANSLHCRRHCRLQYHFPFSHPCALSLSRLTHIGKTKKPQKSFPYVISCSLDTSFMFMQTS